MLRTYLKIIQLYKKVRIEVIIGQRFGKLKKFSVNQEKVRKTKSNFVTTLNKSLTFLSNLESTKKTPFARFCRSEADLWWFIISKIEKERNV